MIANEETGFSAAKLNMVTPSLAHSAVIAVLKSGKPVLLDPFYGTVARSDKGLIGPERAQALMHGGGKFENSRPSRAPKSNVDSDHRFAEASIARQRETMQIVVDVDEPAGDPIQVGILDGRSEDVQKEGAKAGLTPHWDYMGNKYDRAWIRSITVHQATRGDSEQIRKPEVKFNTSQRSQHIVGHELANE